MKRGGGLARRAPLRARSPKEAKRLREFAVLKAAYLEGHPECAVCERPSVDVHHKRGRVGADLLRADDFAALCRHCHTFLTDNPAEAYRIGLSLPRIGRGGAA